MIRTTILTLAVTFAASSAFATGEVYCETPDGSGTVFGYDFGRVPGLAIVGATIRADGRLWSLTEANGAIPIIVAQGARDGMRTVIDFADPEFATILASVRLTSAVEGDDYVTAGTLRIAGVGAFPLVCE